MTCADPRRPATWRWRVVLREPVRTPDGGGGWTTALTDRATVWAHLRPANAYERATAAQLALEVSHVVTIRWREDVANGWELGLGDRTMRVETAFDPDEDRRFLRLTCVETRP